MHFSQTKTQLCYGKSPFVQGLTHGTGPGFQSQVAAWCWHHRVACRHAGYRPRAKIGTAILIGGFTPSEKYEFISWDDDIPNIWENKKCFKPPTRNQKGQHQTFLAELKDLKACRHRKLKIGIWLPVPKETMSCLSNQSAQFPAPNMFQSVSVNSWPFQPSACAMFASFKAR